MYRDVVPEWVFLLGAAFWCNLGLYRDVVPVPVFLLGAAFWCNQVVG